MIEREREVGTWDRERETRGAGGGEKGVGRLDRLASLFPWRRGSFPEKYLCHEKMVNGCDLWSRGGVSIIIIYNLWT